MTAKPDSRTSCRAAISWSRSCAAAWSPSWSALSFAAVPFYSWFCRTTGFGGTTQVAKAAPAQMSDRTITVRFDANVAAGLPWQFEPERRTIDVKLGEVVTVYYTVINEAARVTAGQAGYNVSPPTVGVYFEQDQLLLLHRADA